MRVETRLAVHDGAEVEGVEVSIPVVAAKEHGMRSVQIDKLKEESADVVGVGAAEPSRSAGRVDGDVFCVVEHDVAVRVGVGGAVECADVDEGGRPGRTVGWEELVDEGCSAVEQDGLGSEVKVWVFGFGVLVAIELVLGQNGLVV